MPKMKKALASGFVVILVARSVSSEDHHAHLPDPLPLERVVVDAGPANVGTAIMPPRF